NTRVGAELADTECYRRADHIAELFRLAVLRSRKNEDRVNAAHLRIYGNGYRPPGRLVEERLTATERTAKANGLDQRMPHDCQSHHSASSMSQREHTFGHACFLRGTEYRTGYQLRCSRVGRVSFADHRAAGGKRCRGIASRYRKGDGKIAGAENTDRAQRNQHRPEIRLWNRLAVGQCS